MSASLIIVGGNADACRRAVTTALSGNGDFREVVVVPDTDGDVLAKQPLGGPGFPPVRLLWAVPALGHGLPAFYAGASCATHSRVAVCYAETLVFNWDELEDALQGASPVTVAFGRPFGARWDPRSGAVMRRAVLLDFVRRYLDHWGADTYLHTIGWDIFARATDCKVVPCCVQETRRTTAAQPALPTAQLRLAQERARLLALAD